MSLLPAGAKLGRFEIAGILGQGAMGVVYLANDPEIERPVALKTVRPPAQSGGAVQEVEARFLKEAKLAGRLQHPNIVTVFDVGRQGDVCFIAMEYVDGHPLTRYLGSRDDLTLVAKVGIVRQVAEALAHAHARDVLHRDIKPGNILVGRDGLVKVTDFGIGKFASSASSDLTRTGHMIGSPAYMSPEQVRGEKIDGRADLFSLGVVLYELLTGQRPFPGDSITTLVYQILHTEPRDPLALNAELPAATREVMARLLAKQPERRPADAREFVRELSRIERIQRDSEMTQKAAVVRAAEAADFVPPPLMPGDAPAVDRRSTGGGPAPAPPRSSLPVAILALAALVLAAIFLLREWDRRHPLAAPAGATVVPTAAAATDEGVSAAAAAPTPVPRAAEIILPTPGPREAADATVGASRPGGSTRRERPANRAAAPASPAADETAENAESARAPRGGSSPASGAPASAERFDARYATRRAVRFTTSPDQMRLTIDGRYVGIADDWDNRGGGREFEFDRPGKHIARLELPGYAPRTLEIDVSSGAERDSISIDDELDRRERVPFDKLPGVSDRTTGAVEFQVVPADAVVSDGNRSLGRASAFGSSSPLTLSGPTVHDLLLSAPGHASRLVRILVAPNAGRDRAVIKVTLKPEKR